jgi:hypothetical protein
MLRQTIRTIEQPNLGVPCEFAFVTLFGIEMGLVHMDVRKNKKKESSRFFTYLRMPLLFPM